MNKDNETYVLTEAAILYDVVTEWGLSGNWNGNVYKVAYADLMERLCKAGYIKRTDGDT